MTILIIYDKIIINILIEEEILVLNKSKHEKIIILFIVMIFLGIVSYDSYMSKNKTAVKSEPVILKQSDKPEKINNAEKPELKLDKKVEKVSKKSNKKVYKNIKFININTASVSELSNGLKGIGEAKARLIVLYRKKKGNFSNIEEIKNIKGIGEKTFRRLSKYITV